MSEQATDKARALAEQLRQTGQTEPAEKIEQAVRFGPLAEGALHALRAVCELVLTTIEAIDPKTQMMAEELRLDVEKLLK